MHHSLLAKGTLILCNSKSQSNLATSRNGNGNGKPGPGRRCYICQYPRHLANRFPNHYKNNM